MDIRDPFNSSGARLKDDPMANIVLVEPEIPNNTGNIGRTCVGTNSNLHIVGPTKFEITDKQVRRSGLDYWPHLGWAYHEEYDAWETQHLSPRCFFLTTKVERTIYDIEFQRGDCLVFGPESRGLSSAILEKNAQNLVTIPMLGPTRSLNLANAVSICLYELLRQNR